MKKFLSSWFKNLWNVSMRTITQQHYRYELEIDLYLVHTKYTLTFVQISWKWQIWEEFADFC